MVDMILDATNGIETGEIGAHVVTELSEKSQLTDLVCSKKCDILKDLKNDLTRKKNIYGLSGFLKVLEIFNRPEQSSHKSKDMKI